MLFTKFPDLLKKLISDILRIPYESIVSLQVTNPEMPPEDLGSKFCRLDINMTIITADEKRANLEVQVENEGDFADRSLFHWSRMFSTSIPEGENYSKLPQVIVINILNYKLFDCKEYYSEYSILEVSRHTLLTNKMSMRYFELPKLRGNPDANNMIELWMWLFKARSEKALTKIDELGVKTMKEAIEAFRSITATSEFREMERLRSKARHDEAQALHNAEEKGIAKGKAEGRAEGETAKALDIAKNLLLINLPLEEIVTVTGLTHKEIEALRKAD